MKHTGKNRHLLTGKKGEEMAADFLCAQGYAVLHQNLRIGKDELDLIVENNRFLVFVEVKTRKNNDFGMPESFVDKAKFNRMARTAEKYLESFPTNKMVRFDIVSITLRPQLLIEHLMDVVG